MVDHLSITERFLRLTECLRNFAPLWREQAFYGLNLQWRESYSQLDNALLQLSDSEYRTLDESPQLLFRFIAKYLEGFASIAPFLALPVNSTDTLPAHFDKRLAVDVPGRKWQQIEAFIQSINTSHPCHGSSVVDWCSGKSHLGRALAWKKGMGLRAIERDGAMCAVGQQMCIGIVKGPIKFECRDVLESESAFGADDHVVALHACGDLHRTLIQQWSVSHSSRLNLAPCCYHQWLADKYLPLSGLAQQHDVQLTKNQVRIAVQEMVTSPQRIRRKTEQLKVWRLAFDELQREIRQVDEYLPTPSLPVSAVNKGYESVIHQLAAKKSIEVPTSLALQPYLIRGQQRYQQVQRLNLAALAFRRIIELWLVSDLALYLEQANCQVTLEQFCPRNLTPRNIMLSAARHR